MNVVPEKFSDEVRAWSIGRKKQDTNVASAS
jgi:hypothetical protein